MNEGVAEASERMLKGAGAFAHETPYAVGKHYRQINSSPDVYLVRVPFLNISTSETNCYLICDGGECLAVDTGAPTPEGAVLLDAAIDELGIDKARMSFFLTHLHMDHAGLIDHVAPKEAPIALSLTDFNLMAASSDAEYLRITEAQVSAEGFDCDLVHKSARYGMGIPSFKPEGRNLKFVAEGDVIVVGQTKLEVVDTAGHTPGHLALSTVGRACCFPATTSCSPSRPVWACAWGSSIPWACILRTCKRCVTWVFRGCCILMAKYAPIGASVWRGLKTIIANASNKRRRTLPSILVQRAPTW